MVAGSQETRWAWGVQESGDDRMEMRGGERLRRPLLALAVAAFGIGTSEFIIMGLLPDLARSFAVSIPKAGMLVSGYALSVTVGSPVVALLLARVERRRALLLLMGLFCMGNLLCAVAPSFWVLMGSRVVTALCHGAFFGIGSIVASQVVPPERRSQAIAIMFSGLTLANVLGVPAGTALGQAFGWRTAFLALVPVGLIAGAGLVWMVPSQRPEAMDLRNEVRAVLRPEVQLVLALSTLSSVALFCTLTYIAPILEVVTGFSPHAVTWVLVGFGVAITVGNLLGGRLSDWRQMPTVIGGFLLLVVLCSAMPFTEGVRGPAVGMVMVWGMVQFATGAPLQSRVVDQARGAPNLAATLNQGAFNLGNALGASLGGLVLTAGWGYRRLGFASAAVALLGVGVALTAAWMERQRGRFSRDLTEPVF